MSVRVCLASMSFAPYFGGAARRFHRYLPGLRARGAELSVFASVPLGQPPLGSAPGLRVGERLPQGSESDVPVERVVLPEERSRARFETYFEALAAHCLTAEPRPQVVHLLNIDRSAAGPLRALRAAGIRLVFSDTLIVEPPAGLLGRLRLRLATRLALRPVDAIVVSTAAMRARLRERGVRQPVEVIYNGVDLARFRPAADAAERAGARARMGVTGDGPVILGVGAIEPRKRPDLLLRAFAQTPALADAHVVWVGPTADRLRPEAESPEFEALQALARASGRAERVHFLGETADVEVCYRGADVFALTSEREGMNNAIFEAMASGLPVVSVPFIGLEAAHGTPDTHFALAADEPAALGATLAEVLGSPARRGALAEAGAAWARQEMDVERVLDRYVALWEGLAGRDAT